MVVSAAGRSLRRRRDAHLVVVVGPFGCRPLRCLVVMATGLADGRMLTRRLNKGGDQIGERFASRIADGKWTFIG